MIILVDHRPLDLVSSGASLWAFSSCLQPQHHRYHHHRPILSISSFVHCHSLRPYNDFYAISQYVIHISHDQSPEDQSSNRIGQNTFSAPTSSHCLYHHSIPYSSNTPRNIFNARDWTTLRWYPCLQFDRMSSSTTTHNCAH